MPEQSSGYVLAGQGMELERLQLQSKVWEPAARALLAELPIGVTRTALDVGCGVMGWLRVLSTWIGPGGRVVGSDIDKAMLAGARQLVESEGLTNVSFFNDDLFQSQFAPASFDVVHSRFQIAPLGRATEQVAACKRLVRPGGVLVLEDPDIASWRVNPDAAASQELIALIERAFRAAGGDFNSGRELPALMRRIGIVPRILAHVVALEPGHPYLRLPLQFAASLRPRLEALVPPSTLARLMEQVEVELSRDGTWGTTFTLIQAYGTPVE